jgi:hypothetical protein
MNDVLFRWVVGILNFLLAQMTDESCNGLLKQQIVDENGLYKWELKYFSLDILHNILIIYPEDYSEKIQYSHENDLMICRLSLNGSKYAKEWSASMIGSYGFDLLWSSGRIWSFLAEDEGTCHQWVKCMNQAIEYSSKNVNSDQVQPQEQESPKKNGSGIDNIKPFQSPQQHHSLDEFTTSVTQIEELSPQKLHEHQQQQQRTPIQQTTQRYRQASNTQTEAATMRERDIQQTLLQNRFTTHEGSYISSIPPHSSPSEISPESNTSEQVSKSRYTSSLEPYNMMSDESAAPPSHPKITTEKSLHTTLPGKEEMNHLITQLTSMTERCQHYQQLSEQYLKETDLANQQLEQVLSTSIFLILFLLVLRSLSSIPLLLVLLLLLLCVRFERNGVKNIYNSKRKFGC